MPSSRGSSRQRDQAHVSEVSCVGRRVLYHQHHLGSPLVPDRLALHLLRTVRGRRDQCSWNTYVHLIWLPSPSRRRLRDRSPLSGATYGWSESVFISRPVQVLSLPHCPCFGPSLGFTDHQGQLSSCFQSCHLWPGLQRTRMTPSPNTHKCTHRVF